MGEAAEWAIWSRYGVDISDDGYLENPPKRKRGRPKKESTKPAGLGQDLEGYEEPRCEREYLRHVEYGATKTGRFENPNHPNLAKGTPAMTTTNAREAIALIQLHNGAKLYGVKFMAEGFVKPDQKTYTYKDTQGLTLGFGDLVVVEARDSFAIAQVVQLDVSPSETHVELAKVRHIVQKIDQVAHNARLKIENEAAQKLAIAEIGDRLDKYRQQLGGHRFSEVVTLLGSPPAEEAEVIENDAPFEPDVIIVSDGTLVNIETGATVGRVTTPGLLGRKGKMSQDGTKMFLDGKPGMANAFTVFNA